MWMREQQMFDHSRIRNNLFDHDFTLKTNIILWSQLSFMKYERNQQYSYGAQMQKIKQELLLRATNKPLSHRMTEQWLAANMSLN